MQSTKPYLIRAIHEWCTDQGFTPYLSVAVDDTTRVPQEFVKDGAIVLNVGGEATNQLELGNDAVSFQARFSGRVFPVLVPIERVAAIYARENGQGMAFDVTETPAEKSSSVVVASKKEAAKPASLKVAPGISPTGGDDEPPDDGGKPDAPPPGRSHLTRIK